MKRCSSCKRLKPLSGFQRNRSASHGRCAYCKPCANKKKQESVAKAKQDPDYVAKTKEYQRKYFKKHKARLSARNRRWVKENKEKALAFSRAYYKRYPERAKRRAREINARRVQEGYYKRWFSKRNYGKLWEAHRAHLETGRIIRKQLKEK